MMFAKTAFLAMLLGAEAAPATAAPHGVYIGTKAVLGITLSLEVDITSPTVSEIQIKKPAPQVDCKGEPYTYDGATTITLTNVQTAGDCVHDALASIKVGGTTVGGKLTSVKYDPTTDQITVTAQVTFLSVSVTLSQGGAAIQPVESHESWFGDFMHHFSKSYTADEQPKRFSTFQANLAKIEALNTAGPLDIDAWPTVHTDLSAEEFAARQFV